MKQTLPAITTHFADWYQEVILQAELADHSPVRGCMVIRPYGYALWEHIQKYLDERIKANGSVNASFPLLIPQSFIEKEKEHVQGFAPELAVVTHAGGKQLEEPLLIRPTSETIIHYMFAKWIKSWRDLPMKVNQWANVVRWEMRTRPFLRTTEFLWQEGHTAHETAQEAQQEAEQMWYEYRKLYEEYLAIPVIYGFKSESEKFAGADRTYTVEGIMKDGKALQLCTSHIISQNFARSFNISFQNRDGGMSYPYLTSWGFTTRSIGAVIMVHGDEKGLVLPPTIAPIQVVIIPIFKKGAEADLIKKQVELLSNQLTNQHVRVAVDMKEDETPGAKFFKWELKGVPIRIEVGPRDIENGVAIISDRLGLAREAIAYNQVADAVKVRCTMIHKALFERAQQYQKKHMHEAEKLTLFGPELEQGTGFYKTGWCGKSECEDELKKYRATIRCLVTTHTFTHCMHCDQAALHDIMVAKAY